MRTWPTNIFTLFLACPELYEDLFQICFYLSSAKLNMTVFFCIMIDSSWIFHSQLPLIHISCWFFWQLLPSAQFLKKSQNCHVTNFYIISNLFHYKYDNKNFSNGSAKADFLRNQYWMQNFFKFILQMLLVSYWHILKISCTHIFTTGLFCSTSKKKLKVID